MAFQAQQAPDYQQAAGQIGETFARVGKAHLTWAQAKRDRDEKAGQIKLQRDRDATARKEREKESILEGLSGMASATMQYKGMESKQKRWDEELSWRKEKFAATQAAAKAPKFTELEIEEKRNKMAIATQKAYSERSGEDTDLTLELFKDKYSLFGGLSPKARQQDTQSLAAELRGKDHAPSPSPDGQPTGATDEFGNPVAEATPAAATGELSQQDETAQILLEQEKARKAKRLGGRTIEEVGAASQAAREADLVKEKADEVKAKQKEEQEEEAELLKEEKEEWATKWAKHEKAKLRTRSMLTISKAKRKKIAEDKLEVKNIQARELWEEQQQEEELGGPRPVDREAELREQLKTPWGKDELSKKAKARIQAQAKAQGGVGRDRRVREEAAYKKAVVPLRKEIEELESKKSTKRKQIEKEKEEEIKDIPLVLNRKKRKEALDKINKRYIEKFEYEETFYKQKIKEVNDKIFKVKMPIGTISSTPISLQNRKK